MGFTLFRNNMFVFEHVNISVHVHCSYSQHKFKANGGFRGEELNIDLNIASLSSSKDGLDQMERLSIPNSEADIFRRTFRKADGRKLFLYGYEAHTLPPMLQTSDEISKGGELRWHPLRQEWNVYAPHRQNRTFKPVAADDPLAPSRAGALPTEIPFEDFDLAVFENKFTSLHAHAPAAVDVTGVKTRQAKGHCDVIVYGPESHGDLNSIGQSKRRLLVAAWIDRYQTHYDNGQSFILPFENRGDEVGVTLHHPHGQIYAFPFIPDVQSRAAKAFRDGFRLTELMASVRSELEVTEAGGVSAFCPPFARFPYEVWLAPRKFSPGPWAMSKTEIDGFAHLLGDITRRYDAFFERETAYMLSLHAAPAGHEDDFHFTAQFYPLLRSKTRVKYLASVEQSTGVFTVDVMPDAAAKALRSV